MSVLKRRSNLDFLSVASVGASDEAGELDRADDARDAVRCRLRPLRMNMLAMNGLKLVSTQQVSENRKKNCAGNREPCGAQHSVPPHGTHGN